MTALVLLNSGAGSANKMAARVEKAFAGCGVGVTVRQLSGSEVGAAARDFVAGTTAKPPRSGAPQSNSEILVVAGGDGTIGAAVAAVAGSDIPLGILPLERSIISPAISAFPSIWTRLLPSWPRAS